MSGPETAKRLSEWFSHWHGPLRKFLIGRGTVPVAEVNDVAQEVFLRLLRYDRSEVVEYPQAYLFKMAANVANEWAIRACNIRPHESNWLQALLAEDSPENDAARAEANAELERALNTLTGRQRAVLKLQFHEGLTRPQIAARLDSTERVVKRELMKSYAKLRMELNIDLLRMFSHGRE